MSIGERINQIRRERKLTIDELAQKAYVSKNTIIYWIYHDNVHPDIELLACVADVLGVSLDYLAGRTEIKEMATPGEIEKLKSPKICPWCGQLHS